MTRKQTDMIRNATGEQLLMLNVFLGDQFRTVVNRELDQRSAVRPFNAQPRSASPGHHVRQAA
jgi:hypothetical protein